MNHKKKIGMDKWKCTSPVSEILRIIKQNKLEVYDLTIHQNYVSFYTSFLQRIMIERSFKEIELVSTSGMLGYLLRSLRKPSRIIAILCSIAIWYALSHMVFEVQIKGEKKESRQLIEKTLKEMDYQTPFYEKDVNDLKIKLKKKLENSISWLEIQKMGSRYLITYTPKEFAHLSKLEHDELIAKEDGVIAQFDIQHGSKQKKVNDFVRKGDVLVSNVLADSAGKNQEVYVKGRVYAYTWKDIEMTMIKTKMPKSFQFFQLLLAARREVSSDFKADDKIYKENILQFFEDMGKIKIVIHYTLWKDITTP